MPVPVSWVLAQPELALELRGGRAGVDRAVDLALTTELVSPFRWLSGGELVLTTGIRLPPGTADRVAYLRGLYEHDVAGLGFGTGLSHAAVPADLAVAADDIGLPLFEVPLRTPFAAIVKRVTARLAELQYDAVLRASRAQPRMTRAVVNGGAQAIVQELSRALSSQVLVLDPAGVPTDYHPRGLDDDALELVRAAVSKRASAGTTVTGDMTITYQRISVGRRSYGDLVVVSDTQLSHVDQILLGHANSLLALDFEKPARLQEAQQQLNSHALGLVLAGADEASPAWIQVAQVADARRRIRILVIDCETTEAATVVRAASAAAIEAAGYPMFLHLDESRVVAVLPGDTDASFARRTITGMKSAARRNIRVGLSGVHRLEHLAEAFDNATLAAGAAERGGFPLEFTALAGRALLSFDASRKVLDAVADTLLAPVEEYDTVHGTELMASLRAFLEANGHWETAAAATGVHRHTLRKRVTTAQSLLGCNLDIARVRAELLLAMLARRP